MWRPHPRQPPNQAPGWTSPLAQDSLPRYRPSPLIMARQIALMSSSLMQLQSHADHHDSCASVLLECLTPNLSSSFERIDPWMQGGYTKRDQVLCDLLHVFNVTLRAYQPLHAASSRREDPGSSTCACAQEKPCSCPPAAGLKLSHLQADAQVRLPCLLLQRSTVSDSCKQLFGRVTLGQLSLAAHDTMPLTWTSSGRSSGWPLRISTGGLVAWRLKRTVNAAGKVDTCASGAQVLRDVKHFVKDYRGEVACRYPGDFSAHPLLFLVLPETG